MVVICILECGGGLIMKHFIDPKVDCVFKAILGKQENEALLIDFLNNALNLEVPIIPIHI